MIQTQKRIIRNIIILLAFCGMWLLVGFAGTLSTTGTNLPVASLQVVEPQNESLPVNSPLTYESQQYEVYAVHTSANITVVEVEAASIEATQPPQDRTKPIYEVYKDGYHVEVPAEWQWYIRDMATKYEFDEKIIFGCILAESCFNPKLAGDSERSLGLAQIQKFWIRGAEIEHFTEDYRDRNLLDPYDNILTLMEIWNYAHTTYSLDLTTELGTKQLLYWHNTGKDPRKVTNWKYSSNCISYANELVLIQE